MTVRDMPKAGALRVLLVEDDDLTARIASSLLEDATRAQYVVERTPTMAVATARLAAAQYDALVLDVRLPDGDGITLLGQLRAGGVATPALVYTAAGDVQIIARALRAGAQDYLSKDAAFTEGALDHALASLVARHGAETALRESEARFRALVEHSADAVVVVDAGGAVRYASPSVGGNIGYVPDELLGKSGRRRTGSIRWHPHPEPASQYCFDASIRTGAGGGSRRQVPTVSRTLSSAASSSTSVM